jgi:hypothetical protein
MRKLADYEPVISQVMRLCAKETRFECEPPLAEVLAEYPQLMVAMMHATPLSWLPSISLLALETASRGGRQRSPMGVMDNFFFHLPGLREVARYLSQSDKPLSYHELSARFRDAGDIDLVLFPEGSNCFFGPPDEIQEFRSPKFVELAIETETPLLLGVHTGSENWAKTLPIPQLWIDKLDLLPAFASSFLEKRLRQSGLLTLPVLPLPMERFTMKCELYKPTLTKVQLATDLDERRSQIRAEALLVRDRMRAMLAALVSPS